ncbi:hypothetical protein HZB58_03990 [Candidatus Gottesmanbacteria bacterium]|nr:hypothetical protein [Candidatus Gottesmanbacteria bacterium]
MGTPDTTIIRLRILLRDPELSEKEAISLLARIQRREADIPDAEVYSLLQDINTRDMASRPHRGNQKEKDRRFGFKLRKNRTGSRRG